ncbi:efflux RND transporter permease subunit [Allochromatium tepidum]|uniref:Efflux RND transporter permease subunit n=1 Tax=Allochromatium tepidum TaxID=553982 RepID=A0ABM7QIF5_9GAMM|nr:hypothetical protein Atep_02000 [Allochromatium tepidum]
MQRAQERLAQVVPLTLAVILVLLYLTFRSLGEVLPVMIGAGVGSEVMRPIAAPMLGGMITAPLLSLILLPVLYRLWHERRRPDLK